MNRKWIELTVGCFVLAGIVAMLYLAIQVGGARFFGGESYTLQARFSSLSGVNEGSRVEIAGVDVGVVKGIELNDNFFAIATLQLRRDLSLDDDTLASVKTSGLIGDRYIELAPGGSGIPLEPGDMIVDTESALDIESLISRFALGGGIDENEK